MGVPLEQISKSSARTWHERGPRCREKISADEIYCAVYYGTQQFPSLKISPE